MDAKYFCEKWWENRREYCNVAWRWKRLAYCSCNHHIYILQYLWSKARCSISNPQHTDRFTVESLPYSWRHLQGRTPSFIVASYVGLYPRLPLSPAMFLCPSSRILFMIDLCSGWSMFDLTKRCQKWNNSKSVPFLKSHQNRFWMPCAICYRFNAKP